MRVPLLKPSRVRNSAGVVGHGHIETEDRVRFSDQLTCSPLR